MLKKKILIVLPSLRAGGAERILSFLAKNLNSSEFETRLLIIGFKNDCVYDINGVDVVFLNKKRLLEGFLSIIKELLKYKPKIVISSIIHVNIFMGFMSIFLRKTKFIAREASVMSVMSSYGKQKSFFNFLLKILYPRFSKIICQSSDMKEDLNKNYNISLERLSIINNPITLDYEFKKEQIGTTTVRFITVGRLSKEKGHERILKNLAKVTSYDFHYTIIGSGNLKINLENLTKDLGIFDKVTFISYSSKVFEELSKNHIFLQGSYVEGFPNAVLESCVAGVPIIAFDVPGGTKEIIKNGLNGFLVQDESDFVSILNNEIDKVLQLNSEEIYHFAHKKFGSDKILSQYEELFNSVLT